MEFNTTKLDGLFASTPPLEALKLLISDVATKDDVHAVLSIIKPNSCSRVKKLRVLVHGDDFKSSGTRTSLSWFKAQLGGRFEVKSKVIGSGDDEETECRVLNRIKRRCSDGWEYEGDQRHADFIVKSLDMQGVKFVTSPGEDAKEKGRRKLCWTTHARTCIDSWQREHYMTLDRSDTQFAVKEMSTGMAAPTLGNWRQLKRLARYLKGRPRVIHVDSSAAIGVARRRGNGKLRHVRVGTLWIQELVEEGDISLQKIAGATNVADILTKNVGSHVLDRHVGSLEFVFSPGRAQAGLALQP